MRSSGRFRCKPMKDGNSRTTWSTKQDGTLASMVRCAQVTFSRRTLPCPRKPGWAGRTASGWWFPRIDALGHRLRKHRDHAGVRLGHEGWRTHVTVVGCVGLRDRAVEEQGVPAADLVAEKACEAMEVHR